MMNKQLEKITNEMCVDFLKKIAHKRNSNKKGLEDFEGYYSLIDGSFICSNPEDIKWLLKVGITEQIQNDSNFSDYTANIGFNPNDNKWYGWSHRTYCGFGIGSKVTKKSSNYNADNINNFIEKSIDFWRDEYKENFTK